MPSKEIKELRNLGKLDEAFEMAKQEFDADEENIWTKRNLSWVHYAYLKQFLESNELEGFKEHLLAISNLDLPESETMLFDSCAWQVGKLIFSLHNENHTNIAIINELFSLIQTFHFTRPAESYSFLYKAFHKAYKNSSKYLEFADWWGFENFRTEDYSNDEYNGKKIMSIVEQAYIAYSKKLLEGESENPFENQITIDEEKIHSFLPLLDGIIDKHPEYQYPPYFKAKLLLALGDEENVLSAFLPFAKQKRNDFWVWELMAEIFSEDKETHFACFCKALSLRTPEDFLVKLRQTFAALLVEREMYKEAKVEIEKIKATRSQHEWKLPYQVKQWTEEEWYASAALLNDNKDLYAKYSGKAEEILFKDIPEEIVVVEFVNENKHILNFVKDKNKHGFFNYPSQLVKPQIGDLLSVRLKGDNQNGFFKALTVNKAEDDVKSEAVKEFSSTLRIIPSQNFGFVEDVFVNPQLIEENNLLHGANVTVRAILSFNKKKEEWGWKALSIH